MPVKRRESKRRIGAAAELAAWSELFESGFDLFGDLQPFGFKTGDGDADARAAAPEAWARLGEEFMSTWEPQPGVRDEPWALQKFGRVWEMSRAR